jgi:recombination protein RecT
MSNHSLSTYLQSDAVQTSIESVLGDRKNQFITSVASLVSSNPKLQECDTKSLFSACLVAASLDLPINTNLGFAHIVPYKQKDGTLMAQFQMGYKGFIQLAMRSRQFKTLNVSDVREGEYKGIDRLTGELKIDWIDEDRDKLNVIGYVSFMRLVSGFEKSMYMTTTELNKHGARYSQSMRKGYGLWKDDFDAMAKKTVLKLLLSKYAPMTTDIIKAVETDQAELSGDKIKYLDNITEDPNEVANQKEKQRIIKWIEESKTVVGLEKCQEFIPDDEVQAMYEAKKQLLSKEK